MIQATISGFAQSTATINWTNVHQVIDGFGASNEDWSSSMSSAHQGFFFGTGTGQIGLSILRAGLPNNSQEIGDCTSVGTSCAGAVVGDMQAIVANGGRVAAAPWSPPAAYTYGNATFCASGNSQLNTASYGAYATWFSNFAQSLAAQGVPLYAVSIQNEPDQCQSYDSSEWSGSTIDTFIKSNLGPALSSLSSPPLIFMPEPSANSLLSNYGATCAGDSSCYNYVSGVNFHDYGASISSPGSAPAEPFPSGWGAKKYWETEVSCGSGYGPGGVCPGGFNTSISNALDWATLIDQRLQDGANAWLYWQLIDFNQSGGAGTSSDGSLMANAASGYTVPLRTYALGQYAHFIRPGYYRIDATHVPQSGVTVSAYQQTSSNTLVIVATNYTGSSVSQTFNITNSPTFTTLTPTITSASQSLAQLSNVSVSGNSFTYTLPAQSITTFVGSTASIPPPTNLTGTVIQ